MSEVKPVIKTAEERMQEWAAVTELGSFIQLSAAQFRDFLSQEVKELRAALEASQEKLERLNGLYHSEVSKHQLDYNALQAENATLKKTISDLTKAYERESNDCLKALEERDYWYNKADALADKISEVFDVPIGEHSNVNCPIVEAMKILCGEYITKFDKENAEQAKRIECLELEIAEQNKRIKWFEKTNEEQAKRIVFLKDVIALNHDWHEQYDDYDGYKDSTLCNMNTKALEAQKGTE